MKIKIFIYILFAILFLGCDREKDVPIVVTTHYVDSALLAEYYFDRGSYWVYTNQLMHFDSVFILNTAQGMNRIPCPHGCPGGKVSQYEYYKMDLKSQFKGQYNYYFLGGHIKKNGGGQWGELGQPIFFYNANVGDEFNGVTVTAKYDSLLVENKNYYEVTKTHVTADEQYQQEFDFNTDLYFSANIGLIKKRFTIRYRV